VVITTRTVFSAGGPNSVYGRGEHPGVTQARVRTGAAAECWAQEGRLVLVLVPL
jgi:hypothetical protein